MKQYVYAYFDKVAGMYLQPIYTPLTEDDLTETVKRSVLKDQITGAIDLDLFYLGTYDDKTADFEDGKKFLCHLSDFVPKVVANGSN